MSIPAKGRATAQPDDDDEILDVVAFQSLLDQSVHTARALVQSWIPKDLDSSWDAPAQSSLSNTLASRMRPPRLGLGASASAYHTQMAEEKKIRQRMLPNGGIKPKEELPSRSASKLNDDDDDEDEEESRTRAIKKKGDLSYPRLSNGATSTPTAIAPSSSSKPSLDASPSSPAPTPLRQNVKKEIAPIWFYGGSGAGPSVEPVVTPPVSKNKRKKERDKERLASAKRARLEEVRAEEEQQERQGSTSSEDISLPFPYPVLRNVRPPFAPLMSPSMMSSEEERPSPVPKHEGLEEQDEDESGSDGETPNVSVNGAQANGQQQDGNGKKKRRRKKKNKKHNVDKPVLNLTTS